MISHVDLLSLFSETFDEGFLKDLVFHVHDGYVDAIEKCSGLDCEFGSRAIPQMRHYSIQSRIKSLANRHNAITVQTEWSSTGTEPYTMLISSNFTLTISMVKKPNMLPRSSDFRRSNAVANDHLFSAYEEDDNRYNAILAHVPMPNNRNPASMQVLFPNSDYTRSLHAIDLTPLVEFELSTPAIPKEEIEPPVPRLRDRLPKKGVV